MKKIVKLTESELNNIIKKIIFEQNDPSMEMKNIYLSNFRYFIKELQTILQGMGFKQNNMNGIVDDLFINGLKQAQSKFSAK